MYCMWTYTGAWCSTTLESSSDLICNRFWTSDSEILLHAQALASCSHKQSIICCNGICATAALWCVQWRPCVAAWRIWEFKLTAGGSAVPCHWHETENYLEIDHRLNPLTCVPADCNSLIVDGHFVPFVADCLEQPAKLQHPAIKFRERPPVRQTYGRDPFLVLRNMSHLTSLRSLKVEIPRSHADGGCNTMSPSDVTKKGYGSIVLGDGYSGQLNELKLQEMLCTLLDLGVATCLTSISLKNTDRQGVSCELILPVSLVRLEFLGDSLTTWHAKCLLQGLPSLTHVKLGLNRYEFLREPELISSPCMPAVPGSCSLRW